MERVELRLLGPFAVIRDGESVTPSALRQRTLLAVVAMAAPIAVEPERLIKALWPGGPPAAARAALHSHVSRLRRLLPEVIATDGDTYRLIVPPEDVDAVRFGWLAGQARAAMVAGSIDALDLIESALALWRGEPFTGVLPDWLAQTYGAGLTENLLDLRERQADLRLARGDVTDLVAELTALADRHPLRESLWLRLLTALARLGRKAEALERYEGLRSTLADQLGTDPGSGLRQLHAELLTDGRPSLAGTPVILAPPRQLPIGVAGFVGRDHELAGLDAAVDVAGDRSGIVVLHGTAGVGKTSLAVHWAQRRLDRFPDGQVYLNLRGFGPDRPVEPIEALHSILWSLGVPGEQIPATAEASAARLRSLVAGRQMLFVFDNARDPAQVRPLLPGASGQVLITSRNQLIGLIVREQARSIEVEPLDLEQSVVLLANSLATASVVPDRPGLERLARVCTHLPLALAVAARQVARSPGGTVSESLGRLHDPAVPLDLLADSDESANVRSVLAWSYAALDEATRRCFRMIGLHPGPHFTDGSMAAALGCSVPRARQCIVRLIDGNLVRAIDLQRYVAHDLVGALAAELSAAEETEDRAAARLRLYQHALHSAAAASRLAGLTYVQPHLDPPPAGVVPERFAGPDEALAWFAAGLEHLHAILRTAPPAADRVVLQLAHLFGAYLMQRYRLAELIEVQQDALRRARRSGDQGAAARSLNQLGWAHAELPAVEQSESYYAEAAELFERVGEFGGQAAALSNLSNVCRALGRPREAAELGQRAIRAAVRAAEQDLEAACRTNMALCQLELGEIQAAAMTVRRALRLADPDGRALAYALATSGQALTQLGRADQAAAQLRRALDLFRSRGNRWPTCVALSHLGDALAGQGRSAEARARWTDSLELFDALGAVDRQELRRADLLDRLGAPALASFRQ